MTAGSGLLHIERPPEDLVMTGGLFHGLQPWVNLPTRLKMADPRYQDIRGGEVGLFTSPDGGALLRVIAGEVDGHAGPGVTHTHQHGARHHVTGRPGAVAVAARVQRVVYVLAGRGLVGAEQRRVSHGQLAVYRDGDVVTVAAPEFQEGRSPNLEVLILGGEPIREPVADYGPFVMNTRDELITAFEGS